MRDPAETVRRLHLDYGPVVAFGIGPFRYVALFGPDANRYVLAEHPENFRWREALRTLIPVVGETALVVSDGDEHARRRRIVQPAFSTRRIIGYLDVMTRTMDSELDTWLPGRRLDAFTRLRAVVRKVAVAALFGDTLDGRSDELGDALAAAIDFVNLPVTHQVRVNLPWTRWHKAKTARQHADRIVSEELARRRRNPSSHPTDILAMLINVDDAAPALTDAEIRDQVVSLVAAGYDTTSAAAAWAVHELLANPRPVGPHRNRSATHRRYSTPHDGAAGRATPPRRGGERDATEVAPRLRERSSRRQHLRLRRLHHLARICAKFRECFATTPGVAWWNGPRALAGSPSATRRRRFYGIVDCLGRGRASEAHPAVTERGEALWVHRAMVATRLAGIAV